MKIIRILMMLLVFAMYGCASTNIHEFSEFKLKSAEVLPRASEVSGEKYKVYLEALKVTDYSNESKADLDSIVKSVIERILLDTGNVIFVTSSTQADYHVQSQLMNARLSSNKVEGKTIYYADILGTIKIYYGNGGGISKIIQFKDNSHETVQSATNRDLILNEAISNSIVYGTGDILSQFFSAKGYVISGRKKDDDYIFEVTLGRDKLEVGDQLEVHNIERTHNPLTNKAEEVDRIVAMATVVDNDSASRSWIKVNEHADKICLGDYVKFVNKKGLSKTWNNITKKTTTFMQNIGE